MSGLWLFMAWLSLMVVGLLNLMEANQASCMANYCYNILKGRDPDTNMK